MDDASDLERPAHVDADGGSDSSSSGNVDDGLLSRLRVIEDQPLEQRAEAFAHVHDELRTALEAGEHGDR